MTIHKLEKAEWRPFLDLVSKVRPAKQAEIEVASLKLGDQVEAEWLPLLGLAYDPNDDIVEVALDGLDHMIPRPRELYIDNFIGSLSSLEIIDADGVKQIVKLRDPLMLPPPRTGAAVPLGTMDAPAAANSIELRIRGNLAAL